MSGTNYTVTTLTNKVVWDVDENSYQRALKRIKKLREENEAPQKKLEQAQKRIANNEGKAALAAAKAQTQRLKLAQRLSAEQQKQAQTAAKVAQQEQTHAKKMAALSAKNAAQAMSQDEALARQNLRLSRISDRIRAATAHRAMTYNPNMGGTASDPSVVGRQDAAMARGHAAVSADIAATKRRIADEEKREAALKREVNYYNALRRSALTLANVNGADVATRYKAISAAKEALKAQKEERFTVEETRFEMARITQELRKQARLQNRITREQKAAGLRAGRVNTEKRDKSGAWLLAGGAVGAATLAGSMGISRAGGVLSESLERSKEAKALEQYGISQLEFSAIRDVTMKDTGFSLSADKYADMQKDFHEKAGELLQGSFKTDKKGKTTFSGGGEIGNDLINAVLSKSDQRTAQTVINELQKTDIGGFVRYVNQLGNMKRFGWSENERRFFLESINDASLLLKTFSDDGDRVIDRMNQLSKEGWALSTAQQANLERLSSLGAEYTRVQESLGDHFSASFVAGLGQYATNTDTLRQSMTGLIQIADDLGQSLGELSTTVLAWASRVGELLKGGQTLPDAIYNTAVDDGGNAAADWFTEKTGFDPRSIGRWFGADQKQGGTAIQNAASPSDFGYQPGNLYPPVMPTFTPPSLDALSYRQPLPVSVTGQPVDINNRVDIFVNDGKIDGLIDAKVQDSQREQLNLIAGVVQ
ncbi:chemotaxis protein [Raoultella sp. Lac2]|uniref:chemotaxis protein n=1 Tax=unclassified Raoultella TaxID=2627600 RepID=UPI001352627D|nr:chemotaxis protein [Raoultella sp. Lac2]MXF98122.1 chemotaxis protein [Raoultella sp. Lac1]